MITQDQANAIAESVFPYPELFANDQWTHKDACARIDTRRWAYAKCLMDMNPLIEAATEMREFITCENQTDGATPRCCDSCWGMIAWDTALSNLTKSIEP